MYNKVLKHISWDNLMRFLTLVALLLFKKVLKHTSTFHMKTLLAREKILVLIYLVKVVPTSLVLTKRELPFDCIFT